MDEAPEIVRLKRVARESGSVRVFYLGKKIECSAGQFVMVWLPGIGEKPFSVFLSGRESAVLVRRKGEFTDAMFGLKAGDVLGIRGPFGKGFETKGVKNPLMVAGGCGVASLMMLAQEFSARGKGKKPDFIFGVKTKKEVFCGGLLKRHTNLYITSDDGSIGQKGFATGAAEKLMGEKKYDTVYSCGPEKMMAGLAGICSRKKVKFQFSLERYMKCGIGLCGECELSGMLVCRDGPVFSGEELEKMPDFGRFARAESGRKVRLG